MSERPDSTDEDAAGGTGWMSGGTGLVINVGDGSTIEINEDGVWLTNAFGVTKQIAGKEPPEPLSPTEFIAT